MIRWRVGWYWYALAIGLPLAVFLLIVALNVALGAPAPSLAQFSPWYAVIVVFAVRLSASPGQVAPVLPEPGDQGSADGLDLCVVSSGSSRVG
jgi:hypothetical protein